jgi:cytochrome P450
VQDVLIDNARQFDKQTRSVAKIKATCGDSLLSSDGPRWQKHRRIMQPLFLEHAIQQYTSTIDNAVCEMLSRWDERARRGDSVPVVSEMMVLTLTIATRIFFHYDIECHATTIEDALADILADTWRRMESPLDLSVVSRQFHRKSFRRAIRELDAIVFEIIAKRRRQQGDADDLLSRLLAANTEGPDQQLSDAELRDAVLTLLLAGHETTANALAWAFYCISQSPETEKRVCHEATTASVSDSPDLFQETARAFLETIRLYPSIWIMERRAVSDTQIGGYAIPRGSMVLISPYLLHRHPGFWQDPSAFLPQRFADDNPPRATSGPSWLRRAFFPFGAGAHQCIGESLAKLVAVRVLSQVYRRFQLRLVPGQTPRLVPGITLRHGTELQFQLERHTTRQGEPDVHD